MKACERPIWIQGKENQIPGDAEEVRDEMGVEGYRGQRLTSRAMRRGSRTRWELRDTEARESNPGLCGGGRGQEGRGGKQRREQ